MCLFSRNWIIKKKSDRQTGEQPEQKAQQKDVNSFKRQKKRLKKYFKQRWSGWSEEYKKNRINSTKESPNQRAKRHQKSNAKRTGSFICKTHAIKINNETEKKIISINSWFVWFIECQKADHLKKSVRLSIRQQLAKRAVIWRSKKKDGNVCS